jgi:hypothetical protein
MLVSTSLDRHDYVLHGVKKRRGRCFVSADQNLGRLQNSTIGGFTVAKARAGERTATAADRAPKSAAQSTNITHRDVARRAYALYLERGCEHGHDVDDWMQAENELRANSPTP